MTTTPGQPTAERAELERKTGNLFSQLWGPYDEQLFEESVALFRRRLDLAGFDAGWFAGKTCLDAGCGGGRNSIAMARLGAARVEGIDIGEQGLADARRRAANLPNVGFRTASIMDIPFPDATFDLVWCAGVLMIVANEEQALDELARVVKPGGKLYLLVYATEGLRWPLIQLLRPLAAQLGQPRVEQAIEWGGLKANKRRTFLDDLYCPALDFYTWPRMRRMLEARGFTTIERWPTAARIDHEHNLASYREDLESLLAIFVAGDTHTQGAEQRLFAQARAMTAATVETVAWFEQAVARGELTEAAAMDRIIGQGHHRVLSTKAS